MTALNWGNGIEQSSDHPHLVIKIGVKDSQPWSGSDDKELKVPEVVDSVTVACDSWHQFWGQRSWVNHLYLVTYERKPGNKGKHLSLIS